MSMQCLAERTRPAVIEATFQRSLTFPILDAHSNLSITYSGMV